MIEETSAEEKLSTAGSTSSGGESSGGGDTDILGEDENEIMQDCSDSSNGSPIPSSQLSSVALNQKQTGHHWSFKVNQAIVKCVFQRLLKRDEMIEVRKKEVFCFTKKFDWPCSNTASECLGQKTCQQQILQGHRRGKKFQGRYYCHQGN